MCNKNIFIPLQALIFCVCFHFAGTALANELIRNKAYGYVGGDIYQTAGRREINSIIVGSVTSRDGLQNTTVTGRVSGSIYVSGNIHLYIGSVHTKKRR